MLFAVVFLLSICLTYAGISKAFYTSHNFLYTVVIDAGHGGIDAGAVAPDGGVEKDINLDVAGRLCDILKFFGIDCVMTRTEDKLLADESMKSHRKMTDLKNRLAVVNEVKESGREVVFVSIHMNNFSIPKYSGLQVCATVPAILVECGFLSNPEEYGKLSTSEYRNKLAAVIAVAICDTVGAR